MIKCYHVRRIELVIDTEPQLFFQGPVITPLIATIHSNNEDLEDIWDCCNNSCWWDHKDFRQMKNYKGKFKVDFTNDYSGYCNSDLIVEINNGYELAESIGWKHFDNFDDAVEYAKENATWVKLFGKNRQHPEGDRELSMEELNTIKTKCENDGIKCYLIRN